MEIHLLRYNLHSMKVGIIVLIALLSFISFLARKYLPGKGTSVEERRVELPLQEEVVNRTLALGAYWWRSQIEVLNDISKDYPGVVEANKQAVEKLHQWLAEESIESYLSSEEKTIDVTSPPLAC